MMVHGELQKLHRRNCGKPDAEPGQWTTCPDSDTRPNTGSGVDAVAPDGKGKMEKKVNFLDDDAWSHKQRCYGAAKSGVRAKLLKHERNHP